MVGQGSPNSIWFKIARMFAWRQSMVCAALSLFLLSNIDSLARSEDVHSKFRLTWSGPTLRAYHGALTIDHGSIKIQYPLAMRDDSVGDVEAISPQEIRIQAAPTKYGGLDFEIHAPENARLSLVLDSYEPAGQPVSQSWSVTELLQTPVVIKLDKQNNHCNLDRAAGDRLRVRVARSHLIYSPGEPLSCFVTPSRTGIHAGTGKLHVELIDESTGKSLQEETFPLVLDNAGSGPEVNLDRFNAPLREGVFRIQLRAEPRKRVSDLVHASQRAERAIQFVVVRNEVASNKSRGWKKIDEIEFEQVARWQSVPVLRRFADTKDKPALGEPIDYEGEKAYALSPGQWRIFALDGMTPGKPHMIEVSAPAGHAATCCLSLFDPDATGRIESMTIDSGFSTEADPIEPRRGHIQHRLLFWPKSSSVKLLVHNPSDRQTVLLNRMELFSTDSLPYPSDTVPRKKTGREIPSWDSRPRLVALQLDKALLPEAFGAVGSRDASSDRCYDDWTAFYQSAERLAEYCHWAGYNAVMLNVLGEGGALFPLANVPTSPRFDTGPFYSDGRDPIRKDVVELLMRVFDREGLQLILTLDISGPLPKLETARKIGNGSDLLQRTIDGVPWPGGEENNRSSLVRYNPLSIAVQNALQEILVETENRYASHACFEGIALRLGNNSHLCFAGDRFGYDPQLLGHYATETGVRLPNDPVELQSLMTGPTKHGWLRWRAKRLERFYQNLGQKLATNHRRLFILSNPLFEEAPTSNHFDDPAQKNSNPVDTLLAYGLDLANWDANGTAEFLRADVAQPLESLSDRRWSQYASLDRNLDQVVQNLSRSGAQWVQQPKGIFLKDLPVKEIYGEDARNNWIFPQITPAQAKARRAIVRRIVADDCVTIANGGWIPAMGQEDSLRDILTALSQLPNRAMDTMEMEPNGDQGLNVVVRSSYDQGSLFVLIANDAPWIETVNLHWQRKVSIEPRWLSSEPNHVRFERDGSMLPSEVTLEPYQVLCFEVEDDRAQIQGWSHRSQEGVKDALEKSLANLTELLNRTTVRESPLALEYGSFESKSTSEQIDGWIASNSPSSTIEIDETLPFAGSKSLRIENRSDQSSAWIQSRPMVTPATGRLMVELQMRVDPVHRPRAVTVSLSGRRTDGSKFRIDRSLELPSDLELQSRTPKMVSKIEGRWQPYLLPLVIDLSPDSVPQVQFSIDVAGPGRIWVDDIRLYDLFLTDEERRAIRSDIFYAKRELERSNYEASQWLLDGYWAEFLQRFASESSEPVTAEESGNANSGSNRKTADRGLLQRMREGLRRSRR